MCHSVHNQPHGYWFTAHPCYGAVGSILLQCFLVLHIVWRKLHGFEEKWTEGGRMSFATVNLSFEQKLSVRNCYQSPQPPGCSFLAVLVGRKGYKLLTKIVIINYYPPQTKFAKVMFSQVSICPQGEECLPHCMLGYTSPRTRGRHPPGTRHPPQSRHPPADTPGQ